jgi:eukaryotic-like serine/threonine-protein kinase
MSGQTKHFYAFGPFRLDSERRVLVRDGVPVQLAPKVAETLLLLVESAGHLVDKDDLMKRVWPDAFVEEGNLNKNIFVLRKILGVWDGEREYIETVPKRGYRFVAPVSEVTHAEVAARSYTTAGANLIGKKVSHYRVLEIVGGGGMGLVYKAEDLKLGRRIALKFLPEELGNDARALERFEREARAASSLDHPNICALYEFGEHEGQPFLVMPLLEGQTLRDRISENAPIPTDTLLDIAIQIADGLDAAHQKGIIHRDIKPANVFITDRGEAKILDFGLAKLVVADADTDASPGTDHREEAAAGTSQESLPAANPSLFLSRTGVAMGTAGYMSPEQVRGEKLDARTDLFSFGLVLYEMATGRKPFTGDTTVALHAAILKHSPAPARQLNPELPPKLEAIIHRALEKDREARYQTASQMRAAIATLQQGMQPKPRPRWKAAAASACIVLLLFASVAYWFARNQPRPSASLPEAKWTQLTSNSSENLVDGGSISPDGKYLAYPDREGIHLRLLATGEIKTILQPDETRRHLVSWGIGPWFPDSTRFLLNAYPFGGDSTFRSARGTSVWSASVLGGPPHKLRDEAEADSVSPDGSLISFGVNGGKFGDHEIWLMGPDGEQARKVFAADEHTWIGAIEWSPDGRSVIYFQAEDENRNFVFVRRDLKGGPVVTIRPPAVPEEFIWLPGGRLIYRSNESDGRNLWQARLDLQSNIFVGKPQLLTKLTGFVANADNATADGKRLVVYQWRPLVNVFVGELQAGGTRISPPTRLTLEESWNEPLAWTSDSKSILLYSNRGNVGRILKQTLGQINAETLVTGPKGQDPGDACLSPDGAWVFYKLGPDDPTMDKLMRVPVTGGTPQPVLAAHLDGRPHCARSPATLCAMAERSADRKQLVFTAFDAVEGQGRNLTEFNTDAAVDYWWDLSPDGTRIAVVKNREGQVHILSLNGRAPQDITVKGWDTLTSAAWAADGKSLFVSSFNDRGPVILSVDLQGNARLLWEHLGGIDTYAVPSPDGRHLAMRAWNVEGNLWMMENF